MKILSFILSIIILLLVITPCVDRHIQDNCAHHEMCKDTPGSHQNDPDHCSPFCTCQCCQASCFVSVNPVQVVLVPVEVNYQEIVTHCIHPDLAKLFIPPRV